MVCDALDPKPFIDRDGRAYLTWAGTGAIHSARLGPDRVSLVGSSVELIEADRDWENEVVEAPTLIQRNGSYYLFFSVNHWDSPAYAVGYARCTSPLGPCHQAPAPWLASQGQVQGPGGEDIFSDADGQLWMVFHAWIGTVGYPHGARSLFVIPLTITGARPEIRARP